MLTLHFFFKGEVANEVETEQIVHEAVWSSLSESHVTSFVQIRGSVPSHWAQTSGDRKIVPKPPIFFTLSDPNGRTSGKIERRGNYELVL